MSAQSTAVAERQEAHPIVLLNSQLEKRAEEFRKALPSHITPEKLQRTIVTAAQTSPDLLRADRQSLITAAMKAAQDGLLPDGREAALVIFTSWEKDGNAWKKHELVQYMPMVYGLRKKILQSSEVSTLHTNVVYRAEVEQGRFVYEEGTEYYLRHKPSLDLTEEEMADDQIVAAYSVAKMKDGTVSFKVLRRSQLNKIQNMSQTGGHVVVSGKKKGEAKEPKGPWVDWYPEMAQKTALRSHSKTLPMSGDLIVDIEGREIETAMSAARVLEVEAAGPARLPSRDDLADANEQTGEVVDEHPRDPNTGISEVDEETARQLDAGETDEGQAAEADQDEPAAEEESETDKRLRVFRERIECAENAKVLKAIDGDWVNARAAYDDATAGEIDGLITAKRRELGEGGK